MTTCQARKLCASLCLVAVSAVLIQLVLGETREIDFIQYWGGARLFASRDNPYDIAQMRQMQAPIWGERELPILLWNTPLIFPFIGWLALFSYSAGRLVWLLVQVAAVIGSLTWLARMWQSEHKGAWDRATILLLFFFLVTFFPAILSIHDGQISPLLLLGWCGFLYFGFGSAPRAFLAGVFLSITLLKPHLLYLPYLAIFARAVGDLSLRRSLVGFGAGAVVWLALAALYHPQILEHYLAAVVAPPLYWKTPTLGSFLAEYWPWNREMARILPSLLTAPIVLYFAFFARRVRFEFFLYLIVPLSLLTSPYGWIFDQILLIPSAMLLLLQGGTVRAVGVIGLNVAMLAMPPQYGQQAFIWYSLAFVLLMIGMGAKVEAGKAVN